MTNGTFAEHCRALAQRFLQTAIVVDDEAFTAQHETTVDTLTPPGRRPPSGDTDDAVPRSGRHSLDTKAIIDGFASLGVICGAIGPTDAAMAAIRQADIVVLDWRLKDDDPEFALSLLMDILTAEPDRNALRLVAFYTGEGELDRIQDQIVTRLRDAGLDPTVADHATVTYGHGRIVLYAKPSVNLPGTLRSRQAPEGQLPERLIEDFARLTVGLLPSIALTSLTAVRESAHIVLNTFRADLDPAFLAHRACLANPDEAEQHMVASIASELRSVMEYAVADQEPAGRTPITQWIGGRPHASEGFEFGQHTLKLEEVVRLATDGFGATDHARFLERNFELLSAGLGGRDGEALDERLAWIMASRTVYDTPPPRLWLGTVIARLSRQGDDGEELLICLRPRCDSVRLNGKTSFGFLPLVDPERGQVKLVVRSKGEYRRRGVAWDASGWKVHAFNPTPDAGAVLAQRDPNSGQLAFEDAGGNKYEWRGELKAEFAQRVASAFADSLSRPAVDDSEWLRRSAKG